MYFIISEDRVKDFDELIVAFNFTIGMGLTSTGPWQGLHNWLDSVKYPNICLFTFASLHFPAYLAIMVLCKDN